MGKIILGSSSPRRADILKKMKLDFEIIPSSYVEPHDKADFSYDFVENSAYNKALYVAKEYRNEEFSVIGADTIVVIDNKILEKPKDYQDAKNMLKSLSGKTHFVVTAVAVVDSKTLDSKVKSTTTYVTFEDLSDEQIDYYINNYKPFDKAGAYGIQELPNGFVKSVDGELDNVIGLPSKTVLDMLNL
ncbi:septum formation protein Maf [bacterium]|nr:septum formation protein Maf [bacterium]